MSICSTFIANFANDITHFSHTFIRFCFQCQQKENGINFQNMAGLDADLMNSTVCVSLSHDFKNFLICQSIVDSLVYTGCPKIIVPHLCGYC